MDTKAIKKRLIEIVRAQSYREGNFTLASGKQSTFYLDLKETTLHQEGIHLVGELFVDLIKREGLKAYAVGGITLGADPIATGVSVAAYHHKIPLHSFIVRKQPKAHGTLAWIEGAKTFPKGARLLVVEDVVTTGKSSLDAIDRIREAGFEVEALVTVVDRQEGGADAIRARGVKYFSLCNLDEIR